MAIWHNNEAKSESRALSPETHKSQKQHKKKKSKSKKGKQPQSRQWNLVLAGQLVGQVG